MLFGCIETIFTNGSSLLSCSTIAPEDFINPEYPLLQFIAKSFLDSTALSLA
jgi:hypothetical protein